MVTTGALECGDSFKEADNNDGIATPDDCCQENICEIETTQDIYATFSGIVNCFGDVCATLLNGNKFQCVHDGTLWVHNNGDLQITIVRDCVADPKTVSVGAKWDTPGNDFCFSANNATATDFPQSGIANDLVVGNCSVGNFSGYDGSVTLSLS